MIQNYYASFDDLRLLIILVTLATAALLLAIRRSSRQDLLNVALLTFSSILLAASVALASLIASSVYRPEESQYVAMMERYQTLITSGAPEDIVAYNKELANIQSLYQNPNYSLSFSGEYNWGALKQIKLIYQP